MMWVRVHGVPCHAWSTDFFVHLNNSLGSYISVDENTSSGSNMDITRVLIQVPFDFSLKELVSVIINDTVF